MKCKSKKIVTFKDFAKFVRDEAELANDPIFSPNILKAARTKTDAQFSSGRGTKLNNKGDSGLRGSSFLTSSNQSPSSSFLSSKPVADQVDQPCLLCTGQHTLAKCNKFLKSSVDECCKVICRKGLCYGCFKTGQLYVNTELKNHKFGTFFCTSRVT